MSAQITFLPLFDPPRSRTLDPLSSHKAEEKMKRSGRMVAQCQIVLDLVKRYPGATSKELSILGAMDRHMIARRLPDLRDRDLVYRIEYEVGDCRWWVK